MASLVVQTAFLGDTLLTTPLISELAVRGPVDVVVAPSGAAVLHGNPAIRALVTYDKRGEYAGVRGLLRLASRLRERGNYDAAYLAQASIRSSVLAWRSGARERVGFDDAPGRVLYTKRVSRVKDRHQAERIWRLAFPSGAVPEAMPPIAL